MVYDALAESVTLIEDGLTRDAMRLSRRRRHAAMAVDVDGNVACTLFLRRGVGQSWLDTHLLVHQHGSWVILGGGGGSVEDDLLADRPTRAALGSRMLLEGSGAAARNGDRWSPWGSRWVCQAKLRVSDEVKTVIVGQRTLQAPRHGHLVIVWASRRSPIAIAHGVDGRPLTRYHLPPPR